MYSVAPRLGSAPVCGEHQSSKPGVTGSTPVGRTDLHNRFWSHVDRSGECWLWTARRSRQGYGHFQVDGCPRQAHRVAFWLTYGHAPDGLVVRHTCDERACVRPDHLVLGTQADNCRDAVERRRHSFGERNGQSKLTDVDVCEIRFRSVCGERQADIARAFGVSGTTIRNVVKRRLWRHVDLAACAKERR